MRQHNYAHGSRGRSTILAAVLVGLGISGELRAQPVDLIGLGINANFELPDQTDGAGETHSTRDLGIGWTFSLLAGASGDFGVQDPADGYYGAHPLPAPFDGRQIGYFNLDPFSVGEIVSDPIGAIVAAQAYALDVAVGARNNLVWSDQRYLIGLRTVGGVDLGTFSTVDLDPGLSATNISNLHYALSSAQAAAHVGEEVSIVIRGINLATGLGGAQFTQPNFDNVRLDGTFTLSDSPPVPVLTISRSDGAVTLSNTGTTVANITGYSLNSEAGSFNTANWMSIADNYDKAAAPTSGDGSVDDDDAWSILGEGGAGSETSLSEAEANLTGPKNGGVLANGSPIELGTPWLQTPFEDVVAQLSLANGSVLDVPVEYTGTEIPVGDLTGDADVTGLDWTAFKNGQGTDFTGLSAVAGYLKGDLSGDGAHDLRDFLLFRAAYEMFNGAGSFAALVSGVPEPSTAVCLLLGGLIGGAACRRRRWAQSSTSAATLLLAVVVLAVGCISGTARAELVARYSFDDGSADDEVNGLNGILHGNAMIDVDPDGNRGMVLILDDMEDNTVAGSTHVEISDPNELLDFGAGNPAGHQGSASVAAWVFNDGSGWTNHDPILNQGEWRDGIGLSIKPDDESHLWTGCDDGDGGCSADTSVNSNVGVPADGTWNHVAATWAYNDVANTTLVTYYLNGVALGYAATGVPDGILPGRVASPEDNDGDGIGNTRIGLEWRDATLTNIRWPFNGRIDDLQIYDEALDQGGIENAMAGTVGANVNLSIQVDPINGQVMIKNDTENPIMLNSYQLTSDGSHLNMAGWQSITTDSGYPVGDGTGNGWEPGPNLSNNEIVEWFLLGDSMVNVGQQISLGTAFDTSTLEADRDLRFVYLTDEGNQRTGKITYEQIAAGLPGDYNGNGIVDAADFTYWRDRLGQNSALPNTDPNDLDNTVTLDEYSFWKANFGNVGSGSGSLGAGGQSAVPEPSTGILLAIGGGVLMCCLWRRRMGLLPAWAARSMFLATTAVAIVWGLSGTASAAYTVDRLYHFGDDSEENGAAGINVGSQTDPIIGAFTLDSMGPPGAFVDLDPRFFAGQDPPDNDLPVYVDVSTTGPNLAQARPGAPSGNLGILFDGVGDYLTGLRLNYPHNAPGTKNFVPAGPNNYDGVVTRGLQLWVYPNSAGDGTTQHVVNDTRQHGVRINSDGEWVLLYNNTQIDSNVAVDFDQWSHVMVAMPSTLPNLAVLYVDGVAVAARQSNYTTSAAENVYALTVGADTGNTDPTIGDSNWFNGALDELEMFVWGASYDPMTDTFNDLGQFNFATDNEIAAGDLSGVPGDVDQSGTLTQADIDDFAAGFLSANLVNGILVGDVNSIRDGDLDLNGITDLRDLGLLRDAIAGAGSGAGLNLTALNGLGVPEPSALALGLLAGGLIGGLARRRKPRVRTGAALSS